MRLGTTVSLVGAILLVCATPAGAHTGAGQATPDVAWSWLGLVLLIGAIPVAVTLSPQGHRCLAVVTGVLLAAEVSHGYGAMLATDGTGAQRISAFIGPDGLLMWPLTVLAAWLLWGRHTRAVWLAAAAGLMSASTHLGVGTLSWHTLVPTALPENLSQSLVAIVTGLGLGLVAAVPVLSRRQPRSSVGADAPDPVS